MRKRVLIVNEKNDGQLINASIIPLSQIDLDNLKLLQQYLPEENKKEFTNEEKEIIKKYNDFIDYLQSKNKNLITIDFELKKIKI